MTEVVELEQKPGPEGAAHRLVAAGFDPAAIGHWLVSERIRNTPVKDLATALGDVMAAGAMGFGANSTNLREAVIGRDGVVKAFEKCLQARLDNSRMSPGGVFMPLKMNGG